VVPYPLLAEERAAAAAGPVMVAHDASSCAQRALATAAALFPGRALIVATVGSSSIEPGLLAEAGTDDVETLPLAPHGAAESPRAVADALAAAAAERDAAVIVVGSRGQSARREILLGSVATATVRHAQRPVLVVPDPQRFDR
jgi:nucleotide-binding universal stress UspA family protein